MRAVPRPPLPQAQFEAIFSEVPRLTVEVVIVSDGRVLLSLRDVGPCEGMWHIPGGTVRFGEHLTDAVTRVARQELGLEVVARRLLGYIEYPSHLLVSWDWPVGIAFQAGLAMPGGGGAAPWDRDDGRPGAVRWFSELPDEMHEEQKDFLKAHGLPRRPAD